MNENSLNHIIAAIQTATSPVILISGVGLWLLTMTNRLGRAIDRARALSSKLSEPEPEVRDQIEILMKRSHLLRSAILCAVGGTLCAALLIIIIFVMQFGQKDLGAIIAGLFIGCMIFIIISLILFMMDVNLSLTALKKRLKQ